MINILKELQFPCKLVNLVTISVMDTTVKIKIENSISDLIVVKSRIRQSDILSPILFNLVLEKTLKISGGYEGGMMWQLSPPWCFFIII